MNQLLQDLRNRTEVKNCFAFGEYLHVSFQNDVHEHTILKQLQEAGHEALELKRVVPTIEDCFIHLMKS